MKKQIQDVSKCCFWHYHVPWHGAECTCRLGQFFNFEPEKWDKEGFSWTDSKGQIGMPMNMEQRERHY